MYTLIRVIDNYFKYKSNRVAQPAVVSSASANQNKPSNPDDIVFEDFARMRLQGTFVIKLKNKICKTTKMATW